MSLLVCTFGQFPAVHGNPLVPWFTMPCRREATRSVARGCLHKKISRIKKSRKPWFTKLPGVEVAGFKMYPWFRTVVVLYSPHCSDITVFRNPSNRTVSFWKALKIGHESLGGDTSTRKPVIRALETRTLLNGQALYKTPDIGQGVCFQFSCVLQWISELEGNTWQEQGKTLPKRKWLSWRPART